MGSPRGRARLSSLSNRKLSHSVVQSLDPADTADVVAPEHWVSLRIARHSVRAARGRYHIVSTSAKGPPGLALSACGDIAEEQRIGPVRPRARVPAPGLSSGPRCNGRSLFTRNQSSLPHAPSLRLALSRPRPRSLPRKASPGGHLFSLKTLPLSSHPRDRSPLLHSQESRLAAS